MKKKADNPFIAIRASGADLSDAALRKCIEEARKRAQRILNTGGDPAEAAAFLKRLPKYEDVLFDQSRRDERRRAEQEFKEYRKEAFAAVDAQIKILLEHGDYTEADFTRTYNLVQDILSQDEVRARLSAKLSKQTEQKKSSNQVRKGLDPDDEREINKDLQLAGRDSLYALLDIMPSVSNDVALKKIADLYTRLHQTGKRDDYSDAANRLKPYIDKVFGSDEMRARYDTTLSRARLTGFPEMIDTAARNMVIMPAAFAKLIDRARELGASKDDALDLIREHCAHKKIKVLDASGGQPAPVLAVCGFCGALAKDEHQQKCSNCGEDLYVTCPKPGCGTRVPSDQRACHKCGFKTGDYVELAKELAAARSCLRDSRFADARTCLARARRFGDVWPDLAAIERNIAAEETPYQRAKAAADALIRDRKLNEAQAVLSAKALLPSPDFDFGRLMRMIEADIGRAKVQLADAARFELSGEPDKALDLIEAARAIVVDLPEAEAAARRIPPPPPAAAQAEQTGSAIRLRWAMPQVLHKSQVFAVVRKEGGVPRDANDGMIVGRTASAFLDDHSAPAGRPLYYAVFSDRGGLFSARGAAAAAIVRVETVYDLSVTPEALAVHLTWKAPPGANGVKVWRRAGVPPEAVIDGMPLPAATLTGLHDAPLENGCPQGYLIVPVYPDPARPGSDLLGLPQRVSATPETPVQPVNDLRASCDQGMLSLYWTPPRAADGSILEVAFVLARHGTRFPPAGQQLPAHMLDSIGQDLKRDRTGNVRIPFKESGSFLIVPCIVRGNTATAGFPVPLNAMPGPENLNGRIMGPELHLDWDWPRDIVNARMSWRSDRHVSDPEDPGATRKDISLVEYRVDGYARLIPNTHDDLYIAVFARSAEGDFSRPAQLLIRRLSEVRVFYEIVHYGLFKRDIKICIWSKAAVKLPPLKLVARRNHPPLAPADGDAVLHMPEQVLLPDKKVSVSVPKPFCDSSYCVKLFVADAGETNGIRLLPHDAGKLRLG